VLNHVTGKLDDLGLDVMKAHVERSVQPGHAHKAMPDASPATNRRSSASDPAPAAAPAAEIPVNVRTENAPAAAGSSIHKRGVIRRQTTKTLSAISRVMYTSTSADKLDKDKDGHQKDAHSHNVICETFYARDLDMLAKARSPSERRHEIQAALEEVLKVEQLHGEVMVRILHPSEMALVHTVPQLDDAMRQTTSVVKCCGTHHKALLGEICDHFDSVQIEVIHMELDLEDGQDVSLFYIRKEDQTVISASEEDQIIAVLNALYKSHSVEGTVTIKSGARMRQTGAPSPKRRSSRETFELDINTSVEFGVSASSASARESGGSP